MYQKIKNNEKIVLEAKVQLVTINSDGKPIKIPEILKNFLK